MYRIDEEIIPPVSIFDWLVTFFILIIPGLNLIMLLFWAFAKGINPNKANWAKAMIIFSAVGFVFWFLFLRVLFK
ncbi:MAG: hypothetical protein HY965_07030 [Ignavibacteriales bacterium]|nr:hypothetical protein [Ignavibacteriales bacterium]